MNVTKNTFHKKYRGSCPFVFICIHKPTQLMQQLVHCHSPTCIITFAYFTTIIYLNLCLCIECETNHSLADYNSVLVRLQNLYMKMNISAQWFCLYLSYPADSLTTSCTMEQCLRKWLLFLFVS